MREPVIHVPTRARTLSELRERVEIELKRGPPAGRALLSYNDGRTDALVAVLNDIALLSSTPSPMDMQRRTVK